MNDQRKRRLDVVDVDDYSEFDPFNSYLVITFALLYKSIVVVYKMV